MKKIFLFLALFSAMKLQNLEAVNQDILDVLSGQKNVTDLSVEDMIELEKISPGFATKAVADSVTGQDFSSKKSDLVKNSSSDDEFTRLLGFDEDNSELFLMNQKNNDSVNTDTVTRESLKEETTPTLYDLIIDPQSESDDPYFIWLAAEKGIWMDDTVFPSRQEFEKEMKELNRQKQEFLETQNFLNDEQNAKDQTFLESAKKDKRINALAARQWQEQIWDLEKEQKFKKLKKIQGQSRSDKELWQEIDASYPEYLHIDFDKTIEQLINNPKTELPSHVTAALFPEIDSTKSSDMKVFETVDGTLISDREFQRLQKEGSALPILKDTQESLPRSVIPTLHPYPERWQEQSLISLEDVLIDADDSENSDNFAFAPTVPSDVDFIEDDKEPLLSEEQEMFLQVLNEKLQSILEGLEYFNEEVTSGPEIFTMKNPTLYNVAYECTQIARYPDLIEQYLDDTEQVFKDIPQVWFGNAEFVRVLDRDYDIELTQEHGITRAFARPILAILDNAVTKYDEYRKKFMQWFGHKFEDYFGFKKGAVQNKIKKFLLKQERIQKLLDRSEYRTQAELNALFGVTRRIDQELDTLWAYMVQTSDNIISESKMQKKHILRRSHISKPLTQYGKKRKSNFKYDKWLQQKFKNRLELDEFERLEEQIKQEEIGQRRIMDPSSKIPGPLMPRGKVRKSDVKRDQWLQEKFKDQLELDEFKRLESQV